MNGQKLITAFCALQCLLIAFLTVKIVEIDKQIKALSAQPAQQSSNSFIPTSLTRTERPSPETTGRNKKQLLLEQEQLLRKVIREELATQAADQSTEAYQASMVEPAQEVSSFDQQVQAELISDDIDYFISQGYVSSVEMRNLQTQISRLDRESQKQMLSRLVKAINSGMITGQL